MGTLAVFVPDFQALSENPAPEVTPDIVKVIEGDKSLSKKCQFLIISSSVSCSNPHVYLDTLRFCARALLELIQNLAFFRQTLKP